MTDSREWLWLADAMRLTEDKYLKIRTLFGSVKYLYEASDELIKNSGLFTDRESALLLKGRKDGRADRRYETMIKEGISVISIEDKAYPETLFGNYDPPVTLFVKGAFPDKKECLIGMVGARKSTPYGQQTAKMLARGIAFSGVSVVSGMARGIDSAAHYGALEAGGKTYAVLGCGPDICYPADHMDLYMEIQENGGIISEFPPGSQPLNWHFPMRNRIIAGLSKGVAVIEAARRSGSLITAEMALDMGKDVFAVPGRIDDLLSEGCNYLIGQGAKLITSPGDILSEYHMSVLKWKEDRPRLSADEMGVYSHLSLIPRTPEEISLISGISLGIVMSGLLTLEMKGMARHIAKNQYILNL